MSFFGNRRQIDSPPPPPLEPQPPPRPALPPAPVGFETVLGSSSVLEGVLKSSANVRLDGTFTGSLEINGNVLIGETAKIKADVNARNISIAGAVRGNVTGKKVQILRTGRVWGDIRAAALTTEEGAFIDGKITMVGHESAVGEETPSVDESRIDVPAPVSVETSDAVEAAPSALEGDVVSADEDDQPPA